MGSGRRITCIASNSAMGYFAIAEQDAQFTSSISIRRADGIQLERLTALGSSPVTALAFSWDGRRIVYSTAAPDLHLEVWDWKNKSVIGKASRGAVRMHLLAMGMKKK